MPSNYKKRIASYVTTAGVPASLLGSLGDFFSPKGGANIVFVVGIAALCISILMVYLLGPAGSEKPSWLRRLLSDDGDVNWWWESTPLRCHGVHVAFLFGAICIFFANKSFANIDNGGVLAANVSAISIAQQQLSISKEQLAQLQVLNQTTSELNNKAENFKKETSSDPRKELANRGVTWGHKEFIAAMESGDLEIVGLFLDGRMNLRYDYIPARISRMFEAKEYPQRKQVIELMHSKGVDFIADFSPQDPKSQNELYRTPLSHAIESPEAILWLLANSDTNRLRDYPTIALSKVHGGGVWCHLPKDEKAESLRMLITAGLPVQSAIDSISTTLKNPMVDIPAKDWIHCEVMNGAGKCARTRPFPKEDIDECKAVLRFLKS